MDTPSSAQDEPMYTSTSPQSIVDCYSAFGHYKYSSPGPMSRPSSYTDTKAAVDNSGNMAPQDKSMYTTSSPQSIIDFHSSFGHYKYSSPDPIARPSSYSDTKATVDNSRNVAPPARHSSCHDDDPPHSHHHDNNSHIIDEVLHVHTPNYTPASPMPVKSSGFTPINKINQRISSYKSLKA